MRDVGELVVPVRVPRFFNGPFIPFRKLKNGIRPDRRAGPRRCLRSLLVHFQRGNFSEVFDYGIRATKVWFEEVRDLPQVVLGNDEASSVDLVTGCFLGCRRVRLGLIRKAGRLSPVIVNRLFSVLVPILAFLFAPVVSSNPDA